MTQTIAGVTLAAASTPAGKSALNTAISAAAGVPKSAVAIRSITASSRRLHGAGEDRGLAGPSLGTLWDAAVQQVPWTHRALQGVGVRVNYVITLTAANPPSPEALQVR